MARGWESKSIESQIESFEADRRSAGKERLTPEQIERQRQKDSLLLSRTRVLHDLERNPAPGHRKILENSLAYLDSKLTEFE